MRQQGTDIVLQVLHFFKLDDRLRGILNRIAGWSPLDRTNGLKSPSRSNTCEGTRAYSALPLQRALQMNIRMTALKRARNGDWFGRKAIPADVRGAYRAAHGVSREERFRRDSSMAVERAKQELREWDATISRRINTLRAARRGEGQSLTQREAHALAGEWYLWFVTQHDERPGSVEQWDLELERLGSAYSRFASNVDERDEVEGWTQMPTRLQGLPKAAKQTSALIEPLVLTV